MGRFAHRYADEIFSLGRELQDAVKGRPVGRPLKLTVGIADAVPKLVARRLLQPALELSMPVHLVCHEDKPDRLLAEFAVHNLGVVLSDAAVGPTVRIRAFHQYRVRPIGKLDGLRERFYAISVDRKLKHAAVIAISEEARQKLFG